MIKTRERLFMREYQKRNSKKKHYQKGDMKTFYKNLNGVYIKPKGLFPEVHQGALAEREASNKAS